MVFSCLCCCHSSLEITFFVCTNRISLLSLKYSPGMVVIIAKDFLKLPNMHKLLKQKSPSLLRNLVLATFDELLIVFSPKVNLLYLLYSVAQRCCLLHLIKQNCFLNIVTKTLILMTQVSNYMFSLVERI